MHTLRNVASVATFDRLLRLALMAGAAAVGIAVVRHVTQALTALEHLAR